MKLKKCKLPSFKGNGLNKRKLLTLPIAAGLLMGMFTLPASAATVTISTGDVDGDGLKSKITDIILLSKILTSKQTVFNWSVADINGDGTVSKSDLALLIAQLSGSAPLSPERTEETTSWTGETREYNVYDYSGNATDSDYGSLIDTYDIEDKIMGIAPITNNQTDYTTTNSIDDRVNAQNQSTVSMVYKIGNSGYLAGTGTIVGENKVITAAHVWTTLQNKVADYPNAELGIVVLSWDSDGYVTSNTFFKAISVHIPTLYLTNPDKANSGEPGDYLRANYDYALFNVEEDLTDYGIVEMGIALNSALGNDVSMYGYPGEAPVNYEGDQNNNGVLDYRDYRLFTDSGQLTKYCYIAVNNSGGESKLISSNDQLNSMFRAKCFMSEGHSGGSLILNPESNPVLIGFTNRIVGDKINGVYVNGCTYGVRITPTIYNFVNNNPYFD